MVEGRSPADQPPQGALDQHPRSVQGEVRGALTMPAETLTTKQRWLKREIDDISSLLRLDHWNILNYPRSERSVSLELIKRSLVNQGIIWQYTLIDEYLSDIICNCYFHRKKNEVTYRRLWKEDKFRIFNHFIIEEIYFLQKIRIAHAIAEIPAQHRKSMEAINALRNAIAHSFHPENRRQYLKTKQVIYDGTDIYTKAGVDKLLSNVGPIVDYLKARAAM
jgi:hypothetical protein